jgi:hypothetical protein
MRGGFQEPAALTPIADVGTRLERNGNNWRDRQHNTTVLTVSTMTGVPASTSGTMSAILQLDSWREQPQAQGKAPVAEGSRES